MKRMTKNKIMYYTDPKLYLHIKKLSNLRNLQYNLLYMKCVISGTGAFLIKTHLPKSYFGYFTSDCRQQLIPNFMRYLVYECGLLAIKYMLIDCT